MKLFLYSGGKRSLNHEMNLNLKDHLQVDSLITFIPSSSDRKRISFRKFKKWFRFYGYHNFLYFDLDKEFDKSKIPKLKTSDAIYLSGGNTFHFLHLIKKRNFRRLLRELAIEGKLLIGLSAGSYIITPTIRITVDYHKHKGDFDELNIHHIQDYNGLDLVDFEFIPHYNKINKRDFVKSVLKKQNRDIYACCDGGGMIVKGKDLKLIGDVEKIM